jgi:peptidylprolyl isomerase
MKSHRKPLAAFLSVAIPLAVLAIAAPAEAARKPKGPIAPPPAPAPTAADFVAVDPDNMLVIDTNKGRILVEITPTTAPAHASQIKTLARQHFYDGQTFFRVIDDFMDQTGDPTNKGDGNSALPNLKGEFAFKRDASTPFVVASTPDDGPTGFIGVMPVMSQPDDLMAMTADGRVTAWPIFCPGVAGMARSSDPDSANSQFFLMRQAYPSLNKNYTAWGRVLVGEDVVRAVKVGAPPADPQDKMITVRLGSDLPPDKRPKLYVIDTRTAAFKGLIDKARTEKGADFSVCDVDIPAEVR